jgi:hypothetical protein
MRRSFLAIALFELGGCFPFDEGPPDATEKQVNMMLRTCGVTLHHLEHQSGDDSRLVVTIDDQEPDRAKKATCLSREEDKLGVGFTMEGPSQAG